MVDLLSRFEFMVFPAKSDFVCVCVCYRCLFILNGAYSEIFSSSVFVRINFISCYDLSFWS